MVPSDDDRGDGDDTQPPDDGRGDAGDTGPPGDDVPEPLDGGDIVFLRRVGRGGMGEVWECCKTSLAKVVAAKLLLPAFSQHPDWRARRHEALAVSPLLHPAIPQVYAIHEEPDRPVAIEMEYVPGVTLAARIREEGPLEAAETLEILADLAGALHAAHHAGITHRDVKPGNIHLLPRDPLTGRRRAKLLDWGLALGVPQWGDGDGAVDPFRFAGTPEYMAPEQVRGRAQIASDIWSVGCVLYECLVGRRLFQAARGDRERRVEVLERIVQGQVDLSLLPEETPTGLRIAIEACLRPDPFQRIGAIRDVFAVAAAGAAPAPAVRQSAIVNQLPPAIPSELPRSTLVEEIGAALATAGATVLGGGVGVGKSWLAHQVARRYATDRDATRAAVVVPLGQVADPQAIPAAIGHALGQPPVPTVEALRLAVASVLGSPAGERGRPRSLLLVLDDVDRVREGVERICRALRGIEGLRLLVTSRQPIELEGCPLIDVPALRVPGRHGDRSVPAIGAAEAVRYLVMRIRERRRTFVLTELNAASVAAICERLSGVPLALDAAAASLRTIEPEEFAAELARRGVAWSGGAGLRWCIEQASPDARTLLERLTVFEGSWSRGLARDVVAGEVGGSDNLDPLLNELVDRSLVLFEPVAGRSRYRVPELVRAAARRGLDVAERAGERAELARRHAHAVVAKIQRAATGDEAAAMPPINSAAWLDAIDHLATDAEAAIRWSLGPDGDRALGAGLAIALQHFWFTRARYAEGERLVRALLAARGEQGDELEVRLLAARSKLLFRMDGLAALATCLAARDLHAKRLAAAESISGRDRLIEARLAHNVGLAALGRRTDADPTPFGVDVRAELVKARALWAELGSSEVFSADLSLGQLEFQEGRFAEATVLLDAAIARFEDGGDPVRLGAALAYRARVALGIGDWPSARTLASRSLAVRRESHDPEGVADSLRIGGAAAAAIGQHAAGAALLAAAAVRCVREAAEVPVPERPSLEAALATCRNALGAMEFRRASEEGWGWSDEQAAAAMP
jgi:non-specific serine/threonine protein kinase